MDASQPRSGGPGRRRSFTPTQKLDHLAAYEAACAEGAGGGAYLRREGLYSSQITEWRKLRDAGVLTGGSPGVRVGRPSAEQSEIARLRRQLEVRQLYDQVTSGVTVSEEVARRDFLTHPEKYQPPQTRHLRELVVADEESARSILIKLRGGGSFAALARANSLDASTRTSGGDLGAVTADSLDPAFSGPAFAAAKGQAFGPVHTSLGWYVGLVEDIVQPAPPTFDSVKGQVRQQLESLAQVKSWRVFLQGRLKKGDVQYASAYKPINPDALPDSGLTPGPASATTGP